VCSSDLKTPKPQRAIFRVCNTFMQANTRRNLDHLEYDENLYDFMRSLIPFSLTSANPSINDYLLGDNGIEKGQFLNVYFNDTVGKRELI